MRAGAGGEGLVGRADETARLAAALQDARAGRRRVVLVTGEAGIGKTRLVDAFTDALAGGDGVDVARGQCIEQFGAGEPYLPVLDAVGQLCRGARGAEVVETLRRHAPTWLAQLPAFADVAAGAVPGAPARMLREMADALATLATGRVVVLVLEDLHWSDLATIEWLAYLARRREPARLLVLGTARGRAEARGAQALRDVVRELRAQRLADELELGRLGEEDAAALVAGRAGVPAPPELVRALHASTGGSPLFLTSVVDDLLRRGLIARDGAEIELRADLASIARSVPDDLRALVEKSAGELDDLAQRVLEAGSAVGLEFSAAAVAAGIELPVHVVESACERLVRESDLLRAVGSEAWPDGSVAGRYAFRHALHQAALYERVPHAAQARLHRRIGERKEAAWGEHAAQVAAELASHFELGQDPGRAVRHLRRAAEVAGRRSAHEVAEQHVRRALALLDTVPDDPTRARAELELQIALAGPAIARYGNGSPAAEQAHRRARHLAEALGDAVAALHAQIGLSFVHTVRGEMAQGETLGLEALERASGVGDPAGLVWASYAAGTALLHRGDLARATQHLEASVAAYRASVRDGGAWVQDPAVSAATDLAYALAVAGRVGEARRTASEAVALSEGIGRSFTLVRALVGAARVERELGDGDAIRARLAVAAREHGYLDYLAVATAEEGLSHLDAGRAAEAVPLLERGLAALAARGVAVWRPYYELALVDALLALGRDDQARRAHEALARGVERTGERLFASETERRAALLARSPEEAVERLVRALALAEEQGAALFELRAAADLAALHRAAGDARAARAALERACRRFALGAEARDLARADELAVALGGVPLRAPGASPAAGRAAGATAAREPASPTAPRGEQSFVCEGEFWTVAFAGTVARVRDTRGMRYLRRLLATAYQEIAATTLERLDGAPPGEPPEDDRGDAGEMLDEEARRAYRGRIAELRAELEEAESFHDLGRAEKLREEAEMLGRELSRAVGLGGRARRAGSRVERARVNVTKAIRVAIARIAAVHPLLGAHLESSIRTGNACVYMPPRAQRVDWLV